MGVIALKGMRFFAHHGVYEEEKILGGEYEIDIRIEVGTGKAEQSDDVNDTLNYETVYTICEIEMRKSSDLIEHVAARIIYRLKVTYKNMKTIWIKVSKLNPPLGGRVESVSLESSANFKSKCGKTGGGIICYKDETCWCEEIKILHPRTAQMLDEEFGGCLSPAALKMYLG